MSEYNYKGKIPVHDAYPTDEDTYGEWKEYHSNDIADIKCNWFFLGMLLGGFLSALGWLVYLKI